MMKLLIIAVLLASCGSGNGGNAVLEDEYKCTVIDTGTHFNLECNDGSSTVVEYPEGHVPGEEPDIVIPPSVCRKYASRSFKHRPGKSPVCWIKKKNGKIKIKVMEVI